jgi:hypothetical protein
MALRVSSVFWSFAKAPIAADVSDGSGNIQPMDHIDKEDSEFPVLLPKVLIDRTHTNALIDLLRLKLGFPPEVFAGAVYPVIEGYAGFVQLLPAPESPRHAHPGGRLTYGMELALRALDHRRGQILPRGAQPEAIGARAHRWTYAVFVAALLYGVRNTAAGLRILMRVGGRDPRPWEPLAGSMLAAGASSYRVEIVEGDAVCEDRYADLASRLFNQCVPASVLAWLAEDAALMPELLAWLSGDGVEPRGAIAELVLRAATGSRPSGRTCPTETATQVPSIPSSRDAEQGIDTGPEDAEVEYLEDAIEEAPRPAPPPVTSRPSSTGNAETSDLAHSFIGWLKRGISDGTIRVNEPGALVHGVNEGMLLVSPRIFREFSKQLGPHQHDGRVGSPSDGADTVKWVQRQVLRAGWHLQADRGINILAYQVMRDDRAVSRLSGVVIRNPAQFIDSVPPVNPVLVRSTETPGRA